MLPYSGLPNLDRGLPNGATIPTLNLQNFPSLNTEEAGIPKTLPYPASQQFNAPLFNLQGNQILPNQAQVQPYPNLQATDPIASSAVHESMLRSIMLLKNLNIYQMLPADPGMYVVGDTSQNVNLATGTNHAQAGMRPADVNAIRNYAPEVPVALNPVPNFHPRRYIPMKKNEICHVGRLCRARFYTGNLEMKGKRCSRCEKIYHTYCFLGSNRAETLPFVCCDGSIRARALHDVDVYNEEKSKYDRKQKISQEKRQQKWKMGM